MVQGVFKLFDADGQGKLEEGELAAAIFAMGFSTREHRTMAKDLVGQYSGSLSLEQFTELIGVQLAGRDPEEEIRATFAYICGDDPKNQTINFQVLKSKVAKLKIKLTDSELQSMIADADRSGRGEVGLEEYIQILKNSTWVWIHYEAGCFIRQLALNSLRYTAR